MKEIIITVTDREGVVLFETSPAKIKKELEEDFPADEYEIRMRDLLFALESELELPFYNQT
jgi:hypothetical protein